MVIVLVREFNNLTLPDFILNCWFWVVLGKNYKISTQKLPHYFQNSFYFCIYLNIKIDVHILREKIKIVFNTGSLIEAMWS